MVQSYKLYLIELEGGKWYLWKHPDPSYIPVPYAMAGLYTPWKGVATPPWVEKYRPLTSNPFPGDPTHGCGDDEYIDKLVWKLMKEKGIENVRGGSFQAIDLTKDDVRRLMRKYCNEPQDESEKTILKRMDERLERLEHKYLV